MNGTAPAVLSDLESGVLTITLDQPDQENAWNSQMANDDFLSLERAARGRDIRAILVTEIPRRPEALALIDPGSGNA